MNIENSSTKTATSDMNALGQDSASVHTDRPLITVITSTFNAANLLPGLITSLRQQSDLDFEWIVVDGASTDGTVELIKEASDIVTRYISEPDFSFYHALNKGIALINTEYYLVVGADDRLDPDAINSYRDTILRTAADIIAASVTMTGKTLKSGNGKPWLRGASAYISQHSVGTLIRTSLHKQFGLYSNRFPLTADSYFIKCVFATSGIKIEYADFVAGVFATGGMSSADLLLAMTDLYRIQMLTEKYPLLQSALFAWGMIKNFSRIQRYLQECKIVKSPKPTCQKQNASK